MPDAAFFILGKIEELVSAAELRINPTLNLNLTYDPICLEPA